MSTAVSRSEIGLLYIYIETRFAPQSLELGEAAYNSYWYQWNREVRRRVFLFILRAQRPITVQVPFFAPSLPVFTAASCKRTSGKLQAQANSQSVSLCLAADYQVYGLHCGAGQDNTLDCVCACVPPVTLTAFALILKVCSTLKLLNCTELSCRTLSLALFLSLSHSLLHNISKNSCKICMGDLFSGCVWL